MAEITPRGTLSFTVDGITGGISGHTPSSLTFDFTDPALYANEPQTLSTAFSDIDLDAVGWTNVTWAEFKNLSATEGEGITILLYPVLGGDVTDDGSVAGASLASTLTGAGYYKFITADGTAQGTTWEKGDLAIYGGSSGVYMQVKPQKFTLLPGETCGPFRIDGQGTAWKACSAAGTPQLAKLAIGPCE